VGHGVFTEAEGSSLLEAVVGERLLKTPQAGNKAYLVL
jgi:hypothetical protein